jgi:hypothetical protein
VLLNPERRRSYDIDLQRDRAKEHEGIIAVCTSCQMKNRLRDSNLLGVKCRACGQHFLKPSKAQEEAPPAPSAGARPASRAGSPGWAHHHHKQPTRTEDARALIRAWTKSPQAGFGACNHKLAPFNLGSSRLAAKEVLMLGIPEWEGSLVCGDCHPELMRILGRSS